MIQFRLHNIHISNQTQLAIINVPLWWHYVNIYINNLQKVDLLT